jgi:hypothetical protein
MTDTPKAGAELRDLNRGELVRVHFELYRDLYWSQEMEPKFKGLNPSPDAMRHYREAWDVFIEDRDWEHWRNDETRRCSTDELRAEIAVYNAEIKALEMRRSARGPADTERPSLKDILSGNAVQPAAELVYSLTRSMER